MKKTFIIVCLILSIIGIFIAASPFLLRVTGFDTPAKQYLISKIFGDSKHHFDLQNIDIGLGSFEISEVSFLSEDKRVEVQIDQIVLDFNIIEFLKSPANPKNALRDIFINNPRLIIHSKDTTTVKSTPGRAASNLSAIVAELEDYNSLRINNGKITYKKSHAESIDFAHNLNGWLNTANKNNILVKVKGSAFSPDNENFELAMDLNSNTHDFFSRIDVLKYNFEHSVIHKFVNDLTFKGITNGFLELNGNVSSIDSIHVSGNLQFSEMSAQYNDELFDGINVQLNIDNNRIAFQNGEINYQNHTYILDGFSDNLFKQKLKGTLKSDSIPINDFEKFFPVQLLNGSNIHLSLVYEINPDAYNLKGNISSDNFSVYKSYFSRFEASFLVSNDQIKIPSIFAANDQLELNGRASFKHDQSELQIFLDGDYNSTEHVLFDKLSESNHKFDISFNLNTSTGTSMGAWNYLLSRPDTLLMARGKIEGNNDFLKVDLAYSNFDSLVTSIKISQYLDGIPHVDYAVLKNVPFQILSSDKILNGIFTNISTRFVLSGYANDFNGEVLLQHITAKDTIATLTTHVENLLTENKNARGKVSFKNLNGEYYIKFDHTNLQSEFNLDDMIQGDFSIDLSNEDEQLDGEIAIDDFNFLQALFDSYPLDDYKYQSQINGQIDIYGTLKNPKVKGRLSGEKIVINNEGYFQPEIYLSLDRTVLKADSFKISHNNLEILTGKLAWALLNDQLTGKIEGSNVNITTILNALNIDNSLVSGNAAFNIKLKGSLARPAVEADIKLENGLLDGIKYDNLEIILADEISENSDPLVLANHKIELQKLFIARQGHYHFTGVGSIPFNEKDKIDLLVNFDGDIFNLIPHWEPFFQNGACLSEISLKLTGTVDDIRLAAADITIDRGELWLKDVAPHIENISGTIKLEEQSNQVNIDLIAYVDDDYLKIVTVRDVITSPGRSLEHWYFKGIDLDFGILSMYTSGNGVNLNIPGIMEKQDFGKIHLSGKTTHETFYLAGPVKHPVGYGMVALNDAVITYPFIVDENPSKKPSTAVQFLSNMEWDATLKSGKDVVYVRDIPAYIDNVHAEVTVDETSQGLAFNGIINKGTFKPEGSLVSTRGRLEYLDQNFKVDRFTLDFSHHKDLPDVSGRAWTTIRDSVGAVPKTIYLQLYAIDEATGQIKQSGNWSDFKFKLVSADPTDQETQEQVLSYLGYSVDNIREKATNVGGAITEKYLIRPLLRPIERVLERGLGMDLVRFNSSIARNLFYSSVGKQLNAESAHPLINPYTNDVPYLYLMSSSEVTVGKYINENLYLTYTGQLVSVYESAETGYDFNHSLGLEYRFYKNILLEFEWDRELMGYYNLENQRQYLEDFKVRLRHSFTF